jgi:CBS domain containing-hemolysin-like protein
LLNSDSKKKKFKKNNESSKASWIYRAFIIAFGLSVFFSLISEILLKRVNVFASLFILLIIIAIGVIFDIIGIAVTSASEAPFHAISADKIPGGKEAVKLIRNADIVSNFCNDVVGDICGIISGAAGAAIILKITLYTRGKSEIVLSILLTGIISTLTIGGKAIGKGIAISNSKTVVYSVALFLNTLKKHLNIDILPGNGINKETNRRGRQ